MFAGRRWGRPALVGMISERIGKKEGGVPLAVAVNATVIAETLQMQAAQNAPILTGVPSPPSNATGIPPGTRFNSLVP